MAAPPGHEQGRGAGLLYRLLDRPGAGAGHCRGLGFFYGADAARGQLLSELRHLMGPQGADAITLVLARRATGKADCGPP
ncbi:hypothetical protein LP419_05340 [Massilia sp. H-1]|nr:hypothetical protein LP419_05340 [Massilia sp. H-1]